MNRWSYILLVALRLVIGWHFLVEGYHKFHTHQVGVTSTNKPWTGEPFFREGIGPAAQPMRELLGDPDRLALARLKGDGQTLPAPIAKEWDEYLTRATAHFGLTDDQQSKARTKLDEAKKKTASWLTVGQVELKKSSQWGDVAVTRTIPQWLAEWEAKRQEIADVYTKKLPSFNEDVEGLRLRTLKADAVKLRDDLLAAVDAQTAAMKASLAEVLTPDQKAKGEPAVPHVMRPIDYLDKVTMWTHMVLGACLLLGLFTRPACLGLALFLLTVVLISPALPYAPTPPGAIGNYLYVNLYVIEMVALLALASLPTGQWFGLDAFLGYFTQPRRRLGTVATQSPAARGPAFEYPTSRKPRG